MKLLRLLSLILITLLLVIAPFAGAQPADNLIPFTEGDALNPAFQYVPGNNQDNAYKVYPDGVLAINGAPYTNQWGTDFSAPLITYPITGDFTTQVTVSAVPVESYHVASFGVRSAYDPAKFIRLSFAMNNGRLTVDSSANGTLITSNFYSGERVYFRIERQQSMYAMSYSFDNVLWLPLAQNASYPLPDDVEIFFSAYSTTALPFTAEFTDFQVEVPVQASTLPTLAANEIAFGAADNPAAINPAFTWVKGAAEGSAYQVEVDGGLKLIGAPYTNQWGADLSAPLMTYPINGDFTAQVKIVAEPRQAYHIAGLGVRSAHDAEQFVRASFHMGPSGLAIDAAVNGISLGTTNLNHDEVYLKLVRSQNRYALYYSVDAINWVPLAENYEYTLPADTEIFLTAYSTNNWAFPARFYNFTVLPG